MSFTELENTTNDTRGELNANQVGLLRRLAAIFYDMILLVAILVLASLIVVAPFQLTYGHPLYPLYVLYVYAIAYVYFAWFWTHGGQTLGMRTWGIAIIATDTDKMTWGISLKRFLLALISWLLGGSGFIWSLFDREKKTLHDKYSGSMLIRVVREKKSD